MGCPASSPPHYISKLWLHKLKHFGEPGPIDQSSFLCAHNLVQPSEWSHVDALTLACTSYTWSYLVETFGVKYPGVHGRRPCTRLHPCGECQKAHEEIYQRQVREKTEFIRLRDKWNQEHQYHHSQQPQQVSRVFAISPVWFKQWEQFVQQQQQHHNAVMVLDVPGKIDNLPICVKPTVTNQTTSSAKKKKRQIIQHQLNTSKFNFHRLGILFNWENSILVS